MPGSPQKEEDAPPRGKRERRTGKGRRDNGDAFVALFFS
jgi:hypothetical protein